ncbi:hypothetical protein HaLaN_22724 [Haematococcus lacustris]|uniref:Uncharacterized protein n=1 Tax=Haematococcus lacustris TaxID=44745 RepID=A0A699ZPT9_HAELA|nr:hypothetical protein HaLaN_22724 [Haematococcus lacustris]
MSCSGATSCKVKHAQGRDGPHRPPRSHQVLLPSPGPQQPGGCDPGGDPHLLLGDPCHVG